jgi:hypothetical protein
MSEPEPRRPWWRRKRTWVAVAAWLLLAYPLSLEPMSWLYERGFLPPSAADFVNPLYEPLGPFISDGRGGVRPCARFYVKYLNLFRDPDVPLP